MIENENRVTGKSKIPKNPKMGIFGPERATYAVVGDTYAVVFDTFAS